MPSCASACPTPQPPAPAPTPTQAQAQAQAQTQIQTQTQTQTRPCARARLCAHCVPSLPLLLPAQLSQPGGGRRTQLYRRLAARRGLPAHGGGAAGHVEAWRGSLYTRTLAHSLSPTPTPTPMYTKRGVGLLRLASAAAERLGPRPVVSEASGHASISRWHLGGISAVSWLHLGGDSACRGGETAPCGQQAWRRRWRCWCTKCPTRCAAAA